MFAETAPGYLLGAPAGAPGLHMTRSGLAASSRTGKGNPMSELDLDGTTVTVFGASDQLDQELNTELGRRGCHTHHVPVTTGWLRSATHAVVRVDSRSGAKALRQLAEHDNPRSHVVAVCAETDDSTDRERVNELCRSCGVAHDISLIWYRPFDPAAPATEGEHGETFPTRALAAAVANEIAQHVDPFRAPAFTASAFEPEILAH